MSIPQKELLETEKKCNLLVAANEDYHHVLGRLERKYRTKVKGTLFRRTVHGGVGPIELCLEEESAPETVKAGTNTAPGPASETLRLR